MENNQRLRTMTICLSDIPKEKMFFSVKTGKYYISLQTWDKDQKDQYGNDFSVSISPTKQELDDKKNGQDFKRVFVGSGKILIAELPKDPFADIRPESNIYQEQKQQNTDEDIPF